MFVSNFFFKNTETLKSKDDIAILRDEWNRLGHRYTRYCKELKVSSQIKSIFCSIATHSFFQTLKSQNLLVEAITISKEAAFEIDTCLDITEKTAKIIVTVHKLSQILQSFEKTVCTESEYIAIQVSACGNLETLECEPRFYHGTFYYLPDANTVELVNYDENEKERAEQKISHDEKRFPSDAIDSVEYDTVLVTEFKREEIQIPIHDINNVLTAMSIDTPGDVDFVDNEQKHILIPKLIQSDLQRSSSITLNGEVLYNRKNLGQSLDAVTTVLNQLIHKCHYKTLAAINICKLLTQTVSSSLILPLYERFQCCKDFTRLVSQVTDSQHSRLLVIKEIDNVIEIRQSTLFSIIRDTDHTNILGYIQASQVMFFKKEALERSIIAEKDALIKSVFSPLYSDISDLVLSEDSYFESLEAQKFL